MATLSHHQSLIPVGGGLTNPSKGAHGSVVPSLLPGQPLVVGAVQLTARYGRRSCLELTSAGRAAVEAAHLTRQEFYSRVLGRWPESEQREFARLLTKFVENLDVE